jgi:hypothetical protein
MDLEPITLYIDESNTDANTDYFIKSFGIFSVVRSLPDLKFFYPIFLDSAFPYISHRQLPKLILDAVRQDKCKILIIHCNEGYSWHLYEKIAVSIQTNYNIDSDKIIFVTNNFLDSLKYKSIFCNFWEYNSFGNNILKEKMAGKKAVFSEDSRLYKFVSLNRICHPHRFALVSALYPYKDQGLLSFINSIYYDLNYRMKSFDNFQKDYPIYFDQWCQLNLDIQSSLLLPSEIDPDKNNFVNDKYTNKFYQSYLHIVSETFVSHIFFSEKTFKPIKYFQPFVIINGQYSLQALKKLGYETFSEYIDESYDLESCHETRLIKAVTAGMNFVNQKDLHKIIQKMYPILEHNYDNFISRCKNFQTSLQENISKLL